MFLQELAFNDVNDDGDSSDSDNDHEVELESDSELSFESDEEGNFQQNVNKKQVPVASDSEGSENEVIDDEQDDSESEDLDDDDEDNDEDNDEDEDDVDSDENVYESDDSEELSFEDSDVEESKEKPSTSVKTQKKQTPAKQNGTAKTNDKTSKTVDKTNEPGSMLRVKKNDQNAVEAFKNELNKSDGNSALNGEAEDDEYAKHDTDDEEDIRNTIGNIPMHWYDEYKHIGYDWDAKKIIKPAKRDQLDDFLKRMEDPNFWRTVKDPQTGQDVILSDADIDLIKRINSRRVPDANFDDYTVCVILCCLF